RAEQDHDDECSRRDCSPSASLLWCPIAGQASPPLGGQLGPRRFATGLPSPGHAGHVADRAAVEPQVPQGEIAEPLQRVRLASTAPLTGYGRRGSDRDGDEVNAVLNWMSEHVRLLSTVTLREPRLARCGESHTRHGFGCPAVGRVPACAL